MEIGLYNIFSKADDVALVVLNSLKFGVFTVFFFHRCLNDSLLRLYYLRCLSTIAINAVCNRCIGLGGGTRHLHHKTLGGDIGLTCSEGYSFCSLYAFLRYRNFKIIANDNELALAA